MENRSEGFSMKDALRIAKSDAGQQLFAMLKERNGDTLAQAMEQVAAGDAAKASQTLSTLLASPQVKAMLEDLGRERDE